MHSNNSHISLGYHLHVISPLTAVGLHRLELHSGVRLVATAWTEGQYTTPLGILVVRNLQGKSMYRILFYCCVCEPSSLVVTSIDSSCSLEGSR